MLLKDANETADEYDHGAEVLHDYGRICHQLPELVRPETGIALQMIKECFFVGVIVGIALFHP